MHNRYGVSHIVDETRVVHFSIFTFLVVNSHAVQLPTSPNLLTGQRRRNDGRLRRMATDHFWKLVASPGYVLHTGTSIQVGEHPSSPTNQNKQLTSVFSIAVAVCCDCWALLEKASAGVLSHSLMLILCTLHIHTE